MIEVLLVARREFRGFFAAPAAWLFLGAYLAATLFVFFWVDTFFARNIADVRPLFQWLPLLMIFLVAALTMRTWSEERRSGTIESLLTSPARLASLILGKFLAVMALVAVALALTVPLPLTVSLLGTLDWGPVVGGYVAALLLAAAYAAIGVWSSARTDNPIVALILTVLVCGLFWVIGSPIVTNLFGQGAGDLLARLGTGHRFESITRGVLDLRDLYYYASIVGAFLALNLLQLEGLRWAGNVSRPEHRRAVLLAWLAAANFAAANLWLANVPFARVDLTRGHQYTLSATTHTELGHLDEPLLLRGYFSARTHPLLAPLVPQLKDVLREYGVVARGRAKVEFIDPEGDHAAEDEAASRFNVRPVPFQTADRYQTSVVSSYFDVVVAYGDQHVTLGYRDLIEVKVRGDGHYEVALKDPEYLLTGAIRKVVTSYRGGGNPFDALDAPVAFHGYLSPQERLPPALRTLRPDLDAVLADLSRQSHGKLQISFEDPDAGGGKLAKEIRERYGFAPEVASLVDPEPFWLYMVLQEGQEAVQIPLPEKLDRDSLRQALQAALERIAPGVLRTVGVVEPSDPQAPGGTYTLLDSALAQDARVHPVSLERGRVPGDVDLLLVLSPHALGEEQRFAIDQFLMRGGSVVLCTSPFQVQLQDGLVASRVGSGLEEWLGRIGVRIGGSMVLDPRSAALPVPTERFAGGVAIQEIRMLPYPYFIDLREGGLDRTDPVTASLGQLTMPWASPIEVDEARSKGLTVSRLLRSSRASWTSDSLEVVPDLAAHPKTGFGAPGERGSKTLAVALEGTFESAFKGKAPPAPPPPSPPSSGTPAPSPPAEAAAAAGAPASVIERSPASARLVVVASNAFASDLAINLSSEGLQSLDQKPIEFLQNVADWSLEDPALLALRGRSRFAATLVPLTRGERRGWEYANYALALAGLGLVFAWRKTVARADRRRHELVLAEVKA